MIPPNRPPYPGLRPFEPSESDLFFGRDGCVDQMVAKLAERRFLAVLGSSGTGKSSLVKTGLFSALEMGLLPGAGSRWLIVEMRPGGNPLGNLARALLEPKIGETKKDAAAEEAAVAALETRFKREGPRALIMWCREGHLPDRTNLLILVDQFEELFRYRNDDGREGAQAFVSLLLESRWPRGAKTPAAASLPIYVAITMRSEYLGPCALIEGLAEAVNEGTYLTPRMKRRELQEAIVGPARVSGIEIEPRLVTRVLNDLADFAPWDQADSKDQSSRLARRADQLPLMQHALNRMWWRARERHLDGEGLTLTLADYRGLEQELDDHADQVYRSLDVSVQPTAECVFRAVTSGTTVADAVRRPTKYGELVDICGAENRASVAKVIDAFGPHGCQFLTSDIRQTSDPLPDTASIDIAHESLIRQWKKLSRWVEDEGREASLWRQLRDRAQKKENLAGRTLSDAILLQKQKLTMEWAKHYDDRLDKAEFKKVNRLITLYKWRRWLLVTSAPTAVVAFLVIAYVFYENQQQSVQNFKLAISSAQTVANQVRKSVDLGRLTANGAVDMLIATKEIADRAHAIDDTVETTGLLIDLQHSISDIYYTLGNYDLAYQNAERAKEVAETLQGLKRGNVSRFQVVYDTIQHPFRVINPNDPRVLKFIYDSVSRMGDALSKQGKLDQAVMQYQEARNLAGRLAPDDGAHASVIIGQRLGDVQQARHEFDAAVSTYQTALDVIEKIRARMPNNRNWRRDEAVTRRRIGQALALKQNFTESDFDRALEQFSTAIKLNKQLETEVPTDTITLSNLAGDHQAFAKLYGKRGDWVGAAAEFSLAIEIQERLRFIDPDNATWQFSLGVFRLEMGGALKQQGKLDDALEQYRQAYDLRKELARKDPKNSDRQIKLANAAMAVAGVLKVQNKKLDEAIALYREAIALLDETLPRHDDDVFDCYTNIGDILLSQGQIKEALTEYKRAWSIANGVAADKPDDGRWQERLMNSSIRVGDLLAKQQNGPEALENYQRAMKILTSLAQKNPQNIDLVTKRESLKAKIKEF